MTNKRAESKVVRFVCWRNVTFNPVGELAVDSTMNKAIPAPELPASKA